MTPLAPPFGHPRSGRKGFVPRDPILGTVDDLATTAGDGNVTLTFSTPVGATKYLPQYKASASGTWIDAADPNDPPNILDSSVETSISGLTNGTAYDFRVQVFDLFGSTTSGSVSETPAASAGFGTVNDLTNTAQGDTTLTYEWTQVSDDQGNPAKYAVRIRTPSLSSATWGEVTASEIFVDTSLAIDVTKSVQFTGLTAGTDYEAMLIPFRGTPGSADAFGDFSNSAAGTTTGTSSLGTISDLAASPGDTQVSLSWSPAANATSHQPQYKLNSSGTWLDFGSPLGASASSVTVTGLTNDSLYDFRVEAGDGVTTTNSNVVSATPTVSSLWSGLQAWTVDSELDLSGETIRAIASSESVSGYTIQPNNFDPEIINATGAPSAPPSGRNRVVKCTETESAINGGWFGVPFNIIRTFNQTFDRVTSSIVFLVATGYEIHDGGDKIWFMRNRSAETKTNMYVGWSPGGTVRRDNQFGAVCETGVESGSETIQRNTWVRIDWEKDYAAGTEALYQLQWSGSAWGTRETIFSISRDYSCGEPKDDNINVVFQRGGTGSDAVTGDNVIYVDSFTIRYD